MSHYLQNDIYKEQSEFGFTAFNSHRSFFFMCQVTSFSGCKSLNFKKIIWNWELNSNLHKNLDLISKYNSYYEELEKLGNQILSKLECFSETKFIIKVNLDSIKFLNEMNFYRKNKSNGFILLSSNFYNLRNINHIETQIPNAFIMPFFENNIQIWQDLNPNKLLKIILSSYLQLFCNYAHGDLKTENLLIKSTSEINWIDFEETRTPNKRFVNFPLQLAINSNSEFKENQYFGTQFPLTKFKLTVYVSQYVDRVKNVSRFCENFNLGSMLYSLFFNEPADAIILGIYKKILNLETKYKFHFIGLKQNDKEKIAEIVTSFRIDFNIIISNYFDTKFENHHFIDSSSKQIIKSLCLMKDFTFKKIQELAFKVFK